MRSRTALSLIIGLLTVCPLSGQSPGQGIPSALGVVPSIEVQHLAVSQPNLLTLRGFSAGSPVSLLVAFSAAPTPLASAGYGPAVLGPDPFSPNGATVFGGFVADANGEVAVPFVGQQAHRHWVVHLQAWAPDPGAIYGAAISRHEVFVFGDDEEKVPIAVDAGSGRESLIEAFAYGALAQPVDPRLIDLAFLPAALANANEMGFGRDDRATQAVPDAPEAGLRLVGDQRLFHAQQADGRSGFFVQRLDGSLDVLVWAQGSMIQPAFLPEVGVSAHDPYLAFGAENPVPEYGNATLVLVRSDGENIPGSPFDWYAVPAPGGYAIEASTVCFLAGALIFGDGATRLDRLDLQTLTVSPVVFPPSGGLVPVYVDENAAIARDGSALAIGAGVDKNLHDIYVVDAQGSAVNLSNLPGDYEDAGPGKADGMQLAISDDGGMVAYMRTVTENELFIKSTAPGASEIHVTHAGQYINSIDTVVGLGFKTGAPDVVFSAGKSDTEVDAFGAQIPMAGPVTQIDNLSATSGTTQPVFGLGSTLAPRRFFGTASGRLLEYANSAGPDRLQVVAPGATLALDLVGIIGSAPVGPDVVIVDQPVAGTYRLRAVDVGTAMLGASFSSPPGSSLGGVLERSGTLALLTQDTGTGSFFLYENGNGQLASAPPGLLEGGLHVTSSGRIMAIVRDPVSNLLSVRGFDRPSGTWSSLTTTNASALAARFLR